MINFGPVPAGSVLPVYFSTYGKTNGESITLTGLAATDIEIYKGTSITQRSSDAGYALIDTDGIDVDGITGIHAFSIDTGDNTDSGFFAAGSFYTVVVSAVTIDSQTVNFIAATFRIVAAENTAGTPVADTVRVGGTTQTAGDIIGDTNDIQSRLPAALTADGNMKADTLRVGGTLQTARDIGASVLLSSGTGTGQLDFTSGVVKGNLVSILGTALTETSGQIAAAFKKFFDKATPTGTINSIPDAVAGATGGLFIAGTNAATTVTTSLTTTFTGNVTGNVGGNVTGSVGSLATQAKADVNAEVLDVLNTDTFAEPGQGAPAATATLAAKINYLYKAWRNKKTQTSTTWSLFADDGTTVDQKSTVSDDATTATRGEIATGP